MFSLKLAAAAAVAVILIAAPSQPVHAAAPVGQVESLYHVGDGFNVAGWTIDPTAPSFTSRFRVRLDNHTAASGSTVVFRPDINARYSTSGRHGFMAHVKVPSGDHTLCVDGLSALNTPTVIACYDFEVQS